MLHFTRKQMISRLLLSVVIGSIGLGGLMEPAPLTTKQMMIKAQNKSISNVCDKRKKTAKVKEMCARWAKHL